MIKINNEIYDGVIMKPKLDNALEHYGVKGMKWKKHKASTKNINTLDVISNMPGVSPALGAALATYNLITKNKNNKKGPKFERKQSEYHYPTIPISTTEKSSEEKKVRKKKKKINKSSGSGSSF